MCPVRTLTSILSLSGGLRVTTRYPFPMALLSSFFLFNLCAILMAFHHWLKPNECWMSCLSFLSEPFRDQNLGLAPSNFRSNSAASAYIFNQSHNINVLIGRLIVVKTAKVTRKQSVTLNIIQFQFQSIRELTNSRVPRNSQLMISYRSTSTFAAMTIECSN